MGQHQQHQSERRTRRLLQRQKRVSRGTGEQGARGLGLEPRLREHLCRTQRVESEARELQWMAWNVRNRLQQLTHELVPAGDERFQQASVSIVVRAELPCRVLERAQCKSCGAVVERVANSGGRLDQVEIEAQ